MDIKNHKKSWDNMPVIAWLLGCTITSWFTYEITGVWSYLIATSFGATISIIALLIPEQNKKSQPTPPKEKAEQTKTPPETGWEYNGERIRRDIDDD